MELHHFHTQNNSDWEPDINLYEEDFSVIRDTSFFDLKNYFGLQMK